MTRARTTVDAARQSSGFLCLYALAYAGGVVAYTPFLMLVLPGRVSELAGAEHIRWLGYIVFAGAVAASISGIVSGWLSDRLRGRRGCVAAGLAATIVLQLAMTQCETITALLWTVVAWQLALNLMLVPLIAWAGDIVHDAQKGVLGGLLSIAPPLGALSGAVLPDGGQLGVKLAMIAAMSAVMILPLLLFGARGPERAWPGAASSRDTLRGHMAVARRRMWSARLLMQLSGAGLAAYFYFWLRELDPRLEDGGKSFLFAAGLVISVAAALGLGRLVDRHGQGFRVLALLALFASAALVAMALSGTAGKAKLAYVLFAAANATFLALHAGQTLRVLPDAAIRGRGIGIFNLTNTAPSLIMPWIAISVVPGFGFGGLFLIFAALALFAALLLAAVPAAS
ncbi:MFS transporter [Sphingopyxis sp.]|uniref:MFS transporter n=1 Tax=Sphingopyxis sp. TaxID=1908224 RepID=UPI003D1160F0